MRKKKPHENVQHDRWLISYADFITLLFALFVVLYASSKTDVEKLKKVAESIDNAFAKKPSDGTQKEIGDGFEGPSFPVPPKPTEVDAIAPQTPPIVQTPLDLESPVNLKELLTQLKDLIQKDLGVTDIKDKIEITQDQRGIIMRLSANHFFDSGAAEVKHDEQLILKQIGKIIKKSNRYIRIEGHTDNGKVSSDLYPSNWELSTARAAWVTRFYIKDFAFDPRQIEAAGLAEFHPIADNETPQGKAKNRRVEIIVLEQAPFPEIEKELKLNHSESNEKQN
jgi:chemotaxis protein MotB